LRSWLRSAGLDSNYVDLYSPSVRFGTTAGDLWLPVQSKPLEYMQDESSKCDHLELYAVYHRRLCHRARPDPMDDSCERIPAAVTHSGTGPRPARRRLSRWIRMRMVCTLGGCVRCIEPACIDLTTGGNGRTFSGPSALPLFPRLS